MTDQQPTDFQLHLMSVLLGKLSEGEDLALCQTVATEAGIGDQFRAATSRPDLSRRRERQERQQQDQGGFNRSLHEAMKSGPGRSAKIADRLRAQIAGTATGENK